MLKIINAINILPWNENSANRWGKRNLTKIKKIVVHQSLGTKTVFNTNSYCISKDNHIKKGGLPHIAYHLFIEPDGKVFQCNSYDSLTWHVKGFNTSSIGICCGGWYSYGTTKCRDGNPPKEQLNSLDLLIDYLLSKFKLTINDVYLHGELQSKPSCAGNGITEFLNTKRKK
jgi:N-acetyl-anhydromuramyl-L-alanine amidase AmpD